MGLTFGCGLVACAWAMGLVLGNGPNSQLDFGKKGNLDNFWLWASAWRWAVLHGSCLGSVVVARSWSSSRGRLVVVVGTRILLRRGRGRGRGLRGVGRGHGFGLGIFLVGLSPCLAGPVLYCPNACLCISAGIILL